MTENYGNVFAKLIALKLNISLLQEKTYLPNAYTKHSTTDRIEVIEYFNILCGCRIELYLGT